MKNLALFYGEEELLIQEEIANIKKRLVPRSLEMVNFIVLDGKTVTEEEILNTCRIVPMMEDAKLVIVNNARFFSSGKVKAEESLRKEKDYLLKGLEDIPDHTYLVFSCVKPDKRKKIFKFIQAEGTVQEFKMNSLKDKARWIQRRGEKYGKKLEASVAHYIAEYTKDLYQVDNELKKIAAFIGKDEIEVRREYIGEIFYKTLEGSIFEIMDFIGNKNPSGAVSVLDTLFAQGEKGIVIHYMISKHIMDLLSVKSMEGLPFNDIKDKLGLHPFVLKKALVQSKNFTLDELKRSLNLCQRLDLDIKRGKMEDRQGIELLIAAIS